ncbi:hypothetical protein F2P56_016462 [Juglans regia]|uniref:GATA transcription factor n=2 Tax=Juglans regia TaxID=51240 RepID=A0A833XHT3_JUGRE|nr:GATA transcription factor 9-like [Juglans regia]KAF5466544.1 hypothetical protein F2P56_016462 [Juglans regia]
MELPELFMGDCFGAGAGPLSPEKQKPGENFTVDDLLDFSNEDAVMTDGFFENVAGNSNDSSTVTAVDSCNSGNGAQLSGIFGSRTFGDSQFSGDLFVPYDDLAELEWLSNFVEDSFSVQQGLHFLTGPTNATATKPHTPESSSSSETLPTRNVPLFQPETPLPGKARSKRSRAAPCDWSTRLLHLTTPSEADTPIEKPSSATTKTTPSKKRESKQNDSDSSGRKCLHCAAEKTPQWRTGPMGPKTLCNACGVRYKSGRLVPEYRPVASPTFVSAKHSNSHRKVLELRRQKEVYRTQQQQFLSRGSIFGVSNGGGDDYLIHHRSGPDFRHLI